MDRFPRALGSLAIAFVVGGIGCTSSNLETSTGAPAPSSSSTAVGSSEPSLFQRGCDSAVSGTLPPDWRHHSLITGPVAFVWLADVGSIPANDLGDPEKGYLPMKVLVVVKQGRTERVSVLAPERSKVALLYDPSTFEPSSGRYAFAAGAGVVRFAACPGQADSWSAATQFNGGIIARGPVCLHLWVRGVHTASGSRRIQIAIARGSSCPSGSA